MKPLINLNWIVFLLNKDDFKKKNTCKLTGKNSKKTSGLQN